MTICGCETWTRSGQRKKGSQRFSKTIYGEKNRCGIYFYKTTQIVETKDICRGIEWHGQCGGKDNQLY